MTQEVVDWHQSLSFWDLEQRGPPQAQKTSLIESCYCAKTEQGRKDQLLGLLKVLVEPFISKCNLTLLPGTEQHRETQWAIALDNLPQKLTPVDYNIWLQKQKADYYVVSVKSQLLHHTHLIVLEFKMKMQTGPGTKACQEHSGFHPLGHALSCTHWCCNAYSRKSHTLKSLLISQKVKSTTWFWTGERELWHE